MGKVSQRYEKGIPNVLQRYGKCTKIPFVVKGMKTFHILVPFQRYLDTFEMYYDTFQR